MNRAWLPTHTTFKITTLTQGFHEEATVSELIDMRSKWSDTNLVSSICFAHEAETILKIPLSLQLPEDKVIWAETK